MSLLFSHGGKIGAYGMSTLSGGTLFLSPRKIHAFFTSGNADCANSADVALSIGAAVPREVRLQKLPAAVSSAMGGFKGDQYVLVRNQLVIVDPNTRRVVAVVPDAG